MRIGSAAAFSLMLIFANPAWAVYSLLGSTAPSTVPSPAPVATSAPSGTSINPAANTGQSAENGGSGDNAAIGAALMAAGAAMMANPATVPQGMALMAMGMLALAQSGDDSGAAGQSGATAATSVSSNGTSTPVPTASPSANADAGITSAFQSPAGQQAITTVADAGGTLSPSGLTLPNGQTFPLSTFASTGSMTSAGFDGAGAGKTVAALERKFGIDSGGQVGPKGDDSLAESPGGGGGGVNKPATDYPMPKFVNPFAMTADAKAKMAAGKIVRTASGEPIGVPMDNLFAIIHRAYERKRNTSTFIEAPGSNIQAPLGVKSLVGFPGMPTRGNSNPMMKRGPASISPIGNH